ncbi:MAG: GDSL-type esterase/lipase family protein, partial [Planctomycetota bacterium]|nr:GDSL-type esterase/lipase family protein [Planctomycetota bacterium]
MQYIAIIIAIMSLLGGNSNVPAWVAYADNSSIVYKGRWDNTRASQPWCGWQGSSISMNFDGTSIAMGVIVKGNSEWFKVILDGDISTATKIEVSAQNNWQAIVLAQGLPSGSHHIEVVKETNNNGRITFLGLAGADGLGELPPPPQRSRRIAFYGDSNLAGDSLEHEQNNSQLRYRGCTNSWAGITARIFDADYQNCSISGATISSLNNWYDRINPSDENTQWSFSNWTPDVVVINIGANDIYFFSETRIRTRYNNLLDDMRSTYPQAHIVMANARGWDKNEPANYIEDVVNQRNDPNMSAVIFPWVFEQWHGCETDHGGMA